MLPDPTRYDHIGNAYLTYYAPHKVFHPGVDLNWGSTANADYGQDVISPDWGIVVYVSPVGTNGGLGNYLVIQHPHEGVWTRYLHLEEILVRVGDKVAPYQVIAKLGESGTDSPHLHFEVMNERGFTFVRDWVRPYGRYPSGLSKQAVAGMWLDPLAWLRDTKLPVPPPANTDLQQKLAQAQNALK